MLRLISHFVLYIYPTLSCIYAQLRMEWNTRTLIKVRPTKKSYKHEHGSLYGAVLKSTIDTVSYDLLKTNCI